MIKILITINILITALTACGTGFSTNKTYIPKTENKIINYEDASFDIMGEVIISSYIINLDIEKTRIISWTSIDRIDSIYSSSGIEGITIIKAEIDDIGKIVNHSIVKRAGFGLDVFALEIMKNIIINPARQAGKASKTYCYIRILFKQKNSL